MFTNGWPLMGHPADGQWRAFLDGELSADQQQRLSRHLKTCDQCRRRYAAIQADASWAASRLGALRALADVAPVPQAGVRENLGSRRFGGAKGETMVKGFGNGGFAKLTRKFSAGKVAAAAAALLVVSGLSMPGVRAAASQWMTVFRVQESRIIRLSPDDFQGGAISQEMVEGLMAEMEKLVQVEESRKAEVTGGLSQEELVRMGFMTPQYLPEGFAEGEGFSARTGEVLVRVDVDGVNQLLKSMGRSEQLPAELRGQVLRVGSGHGFGMTYQSGEEKVLIAQSDVPTISASGSVDLNEIFSAFTGMLGDQFGVSATLRRQLGSIDLSRTVPLPLMEGSGTEVKVGGLDGTYHEDKGRGVVMWVMRHRLNVVEGPLSKDELLRIAESIGESAGE